MKRITLIILALFIGFSSNAQNDLLQKGNELYSAEKYTEAIAAYDSLLTSELESAELYFNLGNSYYKTGQVTKAILNYERAKLLAPDDEDIQFNLELANQHVVDAIDALPQVFFVRWWHNLINGKPADTWALCSLISFGLFLLLLGLFVFSSSASIKRIGFWFGILAIVFSLFTFTFASKQKNRIEKHNFAIITQPSVTVKSSPSDSGTDIFLIHEGLKVEVTDMLGGWFEIKLADGNQGWLRKETLEKI